jgi:protein SCO1
MIFQPVFISLDPARDTLPQIALYLKDFHPSFVGATAPSSDASSDPNAPTPYAALKSVCKAYRVYFSTPADADPNGDYLVDHSIFIYLMDPNGQFVEAFGQAKTTEEIVERVEKEIGLWKEKK